MEVINKIRCDKVLVEFLRVNSWIRKWLTNLDAGIDLSVYMEHHAGYDHLPLEAKVGFVERVRGFREVSARMSKATSSIGCGMSMPTRTIAVTYGNPKRNKIWNLPTSVRKKERTFPSICFC